MVSYIFKKAKSTFIKNSTLFISQARLPHDVAGINASNSTLMGHVREIQWTEDGWPLACLSDMQVFLITSDKMNNYNDFGKDETVTLKDFEVAKPKNGKLTVELPSKSVVLVQLK